MASRWKREKRAVAEAPRSLVELHAELVSIYAEIQKSLAYGRCDKIATLVLVRRVQKLEERIDTTPAHSLADAAIKLRLLRLEVVGNLTVRQRAILAEAVEVLQAHVERIPGNTPETPGPLH